jgi:hypothetical protein
VSELERALLSLGRELEYPPTPDLARAVERRLVPARRPRARRIVVVAVAVLLVACGTVLAAVPSARDAVLEFLHLRGATVERRDRLPRGLRTGPLDLGPRTTLPAARRRLAFAPLLPGDLGEPDEVHLRPDAPGGELLLLYRGPRRTLISEFRGDLHPAYVGKITSQATSVERLRVEGDDAIWIAGAPHFFFYRDPNARLREETLRLAGNVLLLERDRLLVRIEGGLSKRAAVRIAASLR